MGTSGTPVAAVCWGLDVGCRGNSVRRFPVEDCVPIVLLAEDETVEALLLLVLNPCDKDLVAVLVLPRLEREEEEEEDELEVPQEEELVDAEDDEDHDSADRTETGESGLDEFVIVERLALLFLLLVLLDVG